MDHYIEITLLTDPEFPATTLMNALFAKLHRGLVDYGKRDIGISFPDVDRSECGLGSRLRLHGSLSSLDGLMGVPWVQGMRDHMEVGKTVPVPAQCLHRVIRRIQAKSSPERMRRRLVARAAISEDEARLRIPDSAAQRLRLPYVEITSRSTQQRFRLFIEHLPPRSTATSGTFGVYGLSSSATVPWF